MLSCIQGMGCSGREKKNTISNEYLATVYLADLLDGNDALGADHRRLVAGLGAHNPVLLVLDTEDGGCYDMESALTV